VATVMGGDVSAGAVPAVVVAAAVLGGPVVAVVVLSALNVVVAAISGGAARSAAPMASGEADPQAARIAASPTALTTTRKCMIVTTRLRHLPKPIG
jgi:hypothetical protein